MALLTTSGIVSRQRGKYRVNGATSVDTQGGREALHRLKAHWAEVARDRLRAGPLEADLFAYNVMSVAERDVDRIREILRAAFKEIRTLVSVSEPEEVVVLLNLHLVNLFSTDGRGRDGLSQPGASDATQAKEPRPTVPRSRGRLDLFKASG